MTITQQKTEITQQSDDRTADIGTIYSRPNSGISTGPKKIWDQKSVSWTLPDWSGPTVQAMKSIADFFSYVRPCCLLYTSDAADE